MDEKKIGKITHYFGKIGVAVIEVTDCPLNVGDEIHFVGNNVDFKQKVASMQIDHAEVAVANIGQSVGLKTDQPVHEGTVVSKV